MRTTNVMVRAERNHSQLPRFLKREREREGREREREGERERGREGERESLKKERCGMVPWSEVELQPGLGAEGK